ncbi:hypothetical protein HOLleu_18299 [Holothuria leucospilota]|uniref:Uncharacterized protein n=1 Tax=Holothuria leucospilota TaxID=206669 RepID=A0A9Q1C3U9_HOLLE|nr:hypothetical protein HOLleu_18299 [Holothuria leucospilota]
MDLYVQVRTMLEEGLAGIIHLSIIFGILYNFISDTARLTRIRTRLGGIVCECNSLKSFQTFVWLLCTSPWQKCRKYLQRSLVTSYGIAGRLVIYFIFMSHLVSYTFAASLGENGCNENCNLSVDHFCKLVFNTYTCMKCKMVCANEDSQSDRDVCNENCQDSQYFPKLPATTLSTNIAPTPNLNSSTLKPSATSSWTEASVQVTSLTVGPTFKDSAFSFTDQGENYFYTIAFLAILSLCFFVWLWCHCASSRRRCKISSDSKDIPMKEIKIQNEDIPMKEIKVQNEGNTAYQTSRPRTENVAVPPSDETQQGLGEFFLSPTGRSESQWVKYSN